MQGLDCATGKQLWSRHVGSRLNNGATASADLEGLAPTAEPPGTHRLVCCASNGEMTVVGVECSRACEVIDACQLGSAVFSSPVAVGSYVFCGCRDDHLYCLRFAATKSL